MRRPTVCVELLHGPDLLKGPCAAVVDTLGLLNALAQARGARRAVVRWQWRGLGGATTRRRGSIESDLHQGSATEWPGEKSPMRDWRKPPR